MVDDPKGGAQGRVDERDISESVVDHTCIEIARSDRVENSSWNTGIA